MNEHSRDFEIDHMRQLKAVQFDIIADQIRKLGGLRDEGLLTEEEFSAKKADLLSQI